MYGGKGGRVVKWTCLGFMVTGAPPLTLVSQSNKPRAPYISVNPQHTFLHDKPSIGEDRRTVREWDGEIRWVEMMRGIIRWIRINGCYFYWFPHLSWLLHCGLRPVWPDLSVVRWKSEQEKIYWATGRKRGGAGNPCERKSRWETGKGEW